MSYINSALPGYNGVLRRETVSYSLDGRDYAQTWNEFVDSANGAPGQIDFKNRRPSKPLPILAASGTSHETLFWPIEVICPKDDQKCDRWANFVQWKTFLDTLRKSLKDGKSQIEFDLVGQIFPKQDLKVVCTVDISEEVVDALQRDGWHQLLCDESH